MMLPLIINSYNLVNFHQNLVKLILNLNYFILTIAFLSQELFFYFFFLPFLEKSDFSAFVDLEKFQP